MKESPTWLIHLVNLKELNLRCNHDLVSSLEFTKSMNKLEELDFDQSNLTTGLEYLPLSLKKFGCDAEMRRELFIYDWNLSLWQAAHPELMKKAGKEVVNLDYKEAEIEKKITIPQFLQEELTKKISLSRNYNPKLDYSDFLLRDGRPFVWENNLEADSQRSLPLRLYNPQTNEVKTNTELELNDYAILSYCWGTDWEKQPRSYGQSYQTDLTKLGRKALNKVIAVWKLINPSKEKVLNHIWIDNFCINQSDPVEKGQEVSKQQQYYNNASVTLIAIDAEIGNEINKENETNLVKHILKKIVTSPWFKRSWTFQEGSLSKQTLFMFDDYLVDGRILALAWGNLQKENRSWELNTNSQILITPLGWSYGAQLEQKASLTLGEALLAVKHRGQTVLVDGIYSILGLLPYGDKVKVEYKSRICRGGGDCAKEKEFNREDYKFKYWEINYEWGIETKDCKHGEKNKKWPIYTEKALERVLAEVAEKAIQQGLSQEVFSFFGSRSNSYWYIPQIQVNGSTSVKGIRDYQLVKNMQVSLQGIQLESEVYRIDEIFRKDQHIRIPIKSRGNLFYLQEISWNGTINTSNFPQMQVGDNLVVISKKKNGLYLAILIPGNINCSIDLALMEFESWKTDSRVIFTDLVNKRIIFGQENILYYQQLIEKEDKQQESFNFWEWNKWKGIHKEFTRELVQKWKEQGFGYKQTYEWASAFKNDFNPLEINFYLWLRDKEKLVARDCEDKYEGGYLTQMEESKSELRNQLTIDHWYPNNKFNQSQIHENSGRTHESFNDLITIGKALNWTRIEAVLIREIKVSYHEDYYGINNIQFTYQAKSEGKWKLVKGQRHGKNKEEKLVTIKLEEREYLTKVEGQIGDRRIQSFSFYTINSRGEEKVYGHYGHESKYQEKFSLVVDNDKYASIFCGKVYGLIRTLDIQQTPHQITNEDLDLIAQIEIPTQK